MQRSGNVSGLERIEMEKENNDRHSLPMKIGGGDSEAREYSADVHADETAREENYGNETCTPPNVFAVF